MPSKQAIVFGAIGGLIVLTIIIVLVVILTRKKNGGAPPPPFTPFPPSPTPPNGAPPSAPTSIHQSPTAPGTCPAWVVVPGYNSFNAISHQDGSDAGKCQQYCDSTPNCNFYTLQGDTCYAKQGSQSTGKNTGLQTFTEGCPQFRLISNIDISTNSYASNHSATEGDCRQFCVENDCNYYTYDTTSSGTNCYLKKNEVGGGNNTTGFRPTPGTAAPASLS